MRDSDQKLLIVMKLYFGNRLILLSIHLAEHSRAEGEVLHVPPDSDLEF